ncbi:MAG: HlyD family type I secretion periplasmic adaptor subunit [Rhizobiaceae bacterium]|nr:HlyD family type I secretion periplasmic adaptor subunit [Rhizobiaceae bacterium]
MNEIDSNIELETNDLGTKIAGIAGFLILFVFGGFWLQNTQLSSAIIVQGKVDIMGEAKTVQHRDGGVISSILVEPGQFVEKDQLLITLDVSEHRIRANATTEKMKHLSARLYRLQAERKGVDLAEPTKPKPTKIGFKATKDVLSRELDLMKMRMANRTAKKREAAFKIQKFENEISGIDAQIASKREEELLLHAEIRAKKHLHEKGYSSLHSLRESQKDLSQVSGSLSKLLSDKISRQHALEEAKALIKTEEISFYESVLSEMISIESELRELRKNLLTDNTIIDRAAIKATSAGRIHKMDVFTVGGVIGPSQELMQIVPEDSALEIGASLETRHIDDVSAKQKAVVRLSGFDTRNTPELNAYVRAISPDIVLDPQTGKPFYKIQVTVPPEEISKLNVGKLVPGMPAEIFIANGERTAFQYLTAPLMDQLRRAFRD